jgi:mono/diheme cytochrome c family protein
MQNMAPTMALGLGLAVVGGVGCRGFLFESPPIHPNPNMDNVTYVEAQEPSAFFVDGRGMRPQIAGTVAQGALDTDDHLRRGQVNGVWAETLPEAVVEHFGARAGAGISSMRATLERGQERFNIYCAPCHGEAGLENGGIVPRWGNDAPTWSWAVTSMHGATQRGYAVGQLYQLITHGIRTMPGYAAQIPVEDRWAVAAYVRALQVAHAAPLELIPSEVASQQGWSR